MKFNLGNLLALIVFGVFGAVIASISYGKSSTALYSGYFIGAGAYVLLSFLLSKRRKNYQNED